MKKDLRITLVQAKLFWEDREKNLLHFSELLKKIKRGTTDLIVLPEMFSTGFSMNAPELAEGMKGDAIEWMKEISSLKNAAVCGSIIIKEKGNYFNRLIWMNPDGSLRKYDKRHLFRMAKEEKVYSAGTEKLIVHYKGWKICPMVCYDLRFPVWSRNKKKNPFDVLIYVANWPAKRRFAWITLSIARAIENQCYVIALNRVGKGGNGHIYTGDSAALDAMGMKISSTKPRKETLETIALSKEKLNQIRMTLPFLKDADDFEIIQ